MSIPDDVDVEQIISRLAGPLSPADREAFRHAAEGVVATLPCVGEGVLWRSLVPLWRSYFHAPPDLRAAHEPRHPRSSKLIREPAIGIDDPRVGGRDRHRFRAV